MATVVQCRPSPHPVMQCIQYFRGPQPTNYSPSANRSTDISGLVYFQIQIGILIVLTKRRDGDDGPWSSFILQIGTPPQVVRTLISTASTQTWAVAPEGCIASDPSNCPDMRGRIYNLNDSSSWVPNLANATTEIYDLGLEANLGYAGVGQYGFDNITLGVKGMGGPSLQNQTLAAISTTDFWMGVFGVNPRSSNFTTYNDPIPSYMQNLRSQSLIPSTSWAYTAGNQYSKLLRTPIGIEN